MKISRDPFAKRGLKLVINTIFPRSKILSPSYPPLLLPHLSLSLSLSLYTSPHLARPLARSLSFLLTFPRSRSHQWPVSLARTASPILSSFSRTTRARIQFLSAKTAGPRVRVSKQTRRTCVLHWRDDITFYPNSPPSPSLVHLPYVELSVPWRRKRRILPAVKQLSHIRTDFLYRNVKRIDKRIFYCRRLFLHFHFSLELTVVNRIDHNYI